MRYSAGERIMVFLRNILHDDSFNINVKLIDQMLVCYLLSWWYNKHYNFQYIQNNFWKFNQTGLLIRCNSLQIVHTLLNIMLVACFGVLLCISLSATPKQTTGIMFSNVEIVWSICKSVIRRSKYFVTPFWGPSWLLEQAMVTSKYVNENTICHFIFDGIINVNPICHHFKDIHCRNVCDLDL